MATHTQGDWINLGYRVDVDVADGLSGICEMSDWMESEEMEANAKLVAAAPDMLEVLQTIENDANQVPEWLWIKIKKVIEKATK